jgi:hypothetical protein
MMERLGFQVVPVHPGLVGLKIPRKNFEFSVVSTMFITLI